MPRTRNQEARIRDAMDGGRPLNSKAKRKLGKESDSATMSFAEFVRRLKPAERSALYDALVEVMGDEEPAEEED